MSLNAITHLSLQQLGWSEEKIPKLWVLLNVNNDPTGEPILEMRQIVGDNLPFWTAQEFNRYMSERYDSEETYVLSYTGRIIIGSCFMYEIGLSSKGTNLAIPVQLASFICKFCENCKQEHLIPNYPIEVIDNHSLETQANSDSEEREPQPFQINDPNYPSDFSC